VLGNADADGLALLVRHAPRQFLGRVENERVRPWRVLAQHPELPVVDPRVGGDLGQVPAHQRELVMAIELADLAQPLGRVLVLQLTAQGIAGVGRIRDDGPLPQAHGDLRQGALLRIHRVDVVPVGHVCIFLIGPVSQLNAGANLSGADSLL